jgi:PAS domain S-box-containing protein
MDTPIVPYRITSAADTSVAERERGRVVLAAISDAVIGATPDGRIDGLNRAAEELLGLRARAAIGRPVQDVVPLELDRRGAVPHGASKVRVIHHPLVLAASEGVAGPEDRWWLVRADGSRVPIEASVQPVCDQNDVVIGGLMVCRDISGVLQRQRERAGFFDLSLDLVCVADFEGRLVQCNPAFLRALGFSYAELHMRSLLDLVHPSDRTAAAAEIAGLATGAMMFDFLCRVRRKDGTYRHLEWRATPDPDGLVYCVARDVTDSLRLQSQLSASLNEKVVLLQEVHHRVKNNLQIMSSLIGLQMRKVPENTARGALRECQARIQAIALIHEKLYQSQDYARVPFSDYVHGLVASLLHGRGTLDGRVKIALAVEKIDLGVDLAIPCGLLLNELVSNALTHAFPGGREGSIQIALIALPGDRYRLSVVDDGIGLPPGFDVERVDSLGFQLVATLKEQLDGTLETSGTGGAAFHLTFGGGEET